MKFYSPYTKNKNKKYQNCSAKRKNRKFSDQSHKFIWKTSQQIRLYEIIWLPFKIKCIRMYNIVQKIKRNWAKYRSPDDSYQLVDIRTTLQFWMRILELLLLSQIWIFDFFVGNNIFLINDRFLWVGCFSFVFGGGLFILFRFRVDSSLSIFENDAQKNLKHVLFECKYLLTISILFRFHFILFSVRVRSFLFTGCWTLSMSNLL